MFSSAIKIQSGLKLKLKKKGPNIDERMRHHLRNNFNAMTMFEHDFQLQKAKNVMYEYLKQKCKEKQFKLKVEITVKRLENIQKSFRTVLQFKHAYKQ